MSYSKKEIRKVKQATLTGFETGSYPLDDITTEEIVELACPASKVTVQSTGTLAFDWAVSVNGEDFVTVGSVAAAALASYSSNIVSSIKFTRTAGSGKVAIACVS